MAIELVPLCTMRIQGKPPIDTGTGPAGTRLVFEVTKVEVQGDRLRGQMEGIAGDWILIGPEGTGRSMSARRFAPMMARASSCNTTAAWTRPAACSSR